MNNMNKKNSLSKKFWIVVLIFCFFFLLFVIFGFTSFFTKNKKVITEDENGGDVVLNYSSDFAGLKLSNLTPVSDNIAMKDNEEGKYFDFSVDISLDNAPTIEYEIAVMKEKEFSTILDDDIRIYLEKERSGTYESVFEAKKYVPIKEKTDFSSPVGSMVLFHMSNTRNSTDRYRLRIWLSSESLVSNGNYGVKVLINGVSE